MSDTSQDVAVNVVNPSLPSSRLTPPIATVVLDDLNRTPAVNSDFNTTTQATDNILQTETRENDKPSDSLTNGTIFEHPNTTNTGDIVGIPESLKVSIVNDSVEHFLSNTDNEGYLSVSTDDTLQNSDNDSDVLGTQTKDSVHHSQEADQIPNEARLRNSTDKQGLHYLTETLHAITMGNQQSGKKKVHSDEDTPDETKTKCCEIPKMKKQKDRNSRVSRSSRSEDNDFDAEEVYPFDIRSRSEQELSEPVELEPFEIIETDDIKFVAGAGTSDVIKNAASEPKFNVIPEEVSFEIDDQLDDAGHDEESTDVKQPFVIDKGNRLMEPGTTTATSTFEFRQIKTKSKSQQKVVPKQTREQIYENFNLPGIGSDEQTVDGDTATHEMPSSGTTTSSGSSKDTSNASSNDASRKNSKEAVSKPSRKNKSKRKTDNEKVNKKTEKDKNAKRDENAPKDQSSENMLILTQTMFSKSSKSSKADIDNKVPSGLQNTYENVGVCAKIAPSGISIGHKDDEKCSKDGCHGEVSTDCIYQNEVIIAQTSMTSLNSQPVQIQGVSCPAPIYETIQSKAQGRQNKDKGNSSYDGDLSSSVSTNKQPESPVYSNRKPQEDKSRTREDSVPPPSPTNMDILEEEEEEEDYEEEDDTVLDTESAKSAEIVEFTENVCKRLSQLLEVMHPEDDEIDEDQTDVKIIDNQHLQSHVYETIPSKLNLDKDQNSLATSTSVPKSMETVSANKKIDDKQNSQSSSEEVVKPPVRSDSSSTLKRISGDSNTYNIIDGQGSSSDDLPEYFDPRGMPPKRDSELLCDVIDSYADETEVKTVDVSAQSVTDIIESNKLNVYETLDFTKRVDKDLSLPLQKGEANCLKNVPNSNHIEELQDRTPTLEAKLQLTALPELAKANEDNPVQFETPGRHSIACTESDLDISEHRDDLSTDSMLADDEDEETMEILFTKTYTEPVEGAEVFLSCTVVNSAYKEEHKKSETWLSDEALEYFEANAADVMSTAFMKAKKEMKDIQVCLQSLRKQMEHFHGDCEYDDISLPDIPVDSLSPDYFVLPRKAVTD